VNWTGVLMTAGVGAASMAWMPYSLPLLLGLVWVWRRS